MRMRSGLRVLVDAFGEGLHGHVPVGVYGDAGEDGGQDCGHSTRDAKAHDDIDSDPRASASEDTLVL